jgi:hypothetical protein
MKKFLIGGGLSVFAFTLCAIPALAEKNNANGAQTYAWNLSGDVMPVPPYGSGDIIGSDTASKLIINQPDCTGKVNITGVMNGLNPNTEYTVYLSKPYQTNIARYNVVGTWKWFVLNTYEHDLVITSQNLDGTFVATGGYPANNSPYTSAGQTPEVITNGKVDGDKITFTTTYAGPYNPGYSATVTGTINSNGTITGNSPVEWHSTFGGATSKLIGTGFPGLLPDLSTFTFMTDESGSGSWHYNLDPAVNFSVWINGGGRTILISNNVTLKTSCESDSEEITTGTKADILKNSGVKGKGILTAPGLQKPFNGNSQAAEHAGKKK